jgi:hypothetical protein
MEREAEQQARELAQLHRTIAKMSNMLQTQTALLEAHWRGMKTWLEGTEEKQAAYHPDHVRWGKGITDMVKRVVATTERGQREERKADTEGVSLEASIHADPTQTGEPKKPEEHQQLQPGGQLISVPTPKPNLKPNPAPAPAPDPAPTPTPTPRATSTPIETTTSAPAPTPTRLW